MQYSDLKKAFVQYNWLLRVLLLVVGVNLILAAHIRIRNDDRYKWQDVTSERLPLEVERIYDGAGQFRYFCLDVKEGDVFTPPESWP